MDDERIQQLRTEAAAAGDHAQVLICYIATGEVAPMSLWVMAFLSAADRRRIVEKFSTREDARAECERVIAARGRAK